MNWYLQVLRKYAVFSGRARRKEFWMSTLVNLLILIALKVVDTLMGTVDRATNIGFVSTLYMLAVALPFIGVSVRRLHDTNRSGWWYLIIAIPLVGAIIMCIFAAQDSQPGENQYGPNPKEGAVS